jgi:hypothetical protein
MNKSVPKRPVPDRPEPNVMYLNTAPSVNCANVIFMAIIVLCVALLMVVMYAIGYTEGQDACPDNTYEVARWEPCCGMVYGPRKVIVFGITYAENPFPMTVVDFVVQNGYTYWTYAQGTDPEVYFLQDYPPFAAPGDDKKFAMPGVTDISSQISHIGWCVFDEQSYLPMAVI